MTIQCVRSTGSSLPTQAALSFRPEGKGMRVSFSGALTAYSLTKADKALREHLGMPAGSVIFDLRELAFLDTSGALFLNLAFWSSCGPKACAPAWKT